LPYSISCLLPTITKIIDELFNGFTLQLEEKKVITYSGSVIDATFVDAPRQRNSREENKTIKEGGVPAEWEKEKNKNKRRQKDVDARWAKKNDYGERSSGKGPGTLQCCCCRWHEVDLGRQTGRCSHY
jgi:hypothetical protein